jgi:NADH:ubiquinone oxidoreductase subunit 2 (subunit N)
MSLAGLPPFSGFLGKLIVILELSHSNFNFILIPILLGTLIRLFFYLRVALINIIKTKSQLTLTNLKPKNKTPILLINLIALFAAGPVFILILDFKLFKLKAFKALKKGVLKSSKS